MIMPLPSSSSLAVLTSIETTPGRSRSTRFGMLAPPSMAAPGDAVPSLIVAMFVEELLLLLAKAVTPAPTPPPISAATTATRIQLLPRRSSLRPGRCWDRPKLALGGAGQRLGHSWVTAPGQVGAAHGIVAGEPTGSGWPPGGTAHAVRADG